MDTTPPSEGGGAGSIPAEGNKKQKFKNFCFLLLKNLRFYTRGGSALGRDSLPAGRLLGVLARRGFFLDSLQDF